MPLPRHVLCCTVTPPHDSRALLVRAQRRALLDAFVAAKGASISIGVEGNPGPPCIHQPYSVLRVSAS